MTGGAEGCLPGCGGAGGRLRHVRERMRAREIASNSTRRPFSRGHVRSARRRTGSSGVHVRDSGRLHVGTVHASADRVRRIHGPDRWCTKPMPARSSPAMPQVRCGTLPRPPDGCASPLGFDRDAGEDSHATAEAHHARLPSWTLGPPDQPRLRFHAPCERRPLPIMLVRAAPRTDRIRIRHAVSASFALPNGACAPRDDT